MMKTGLKTIYCMKLTAIYFMPIELNLEEKLDFPGTHQDFKISTRVYGISAGVGPLVQNTPLLLRALLIYAFLVLLLIVD